MKDVLIIVPSRGRTAKLIRMLDSIPREPWIHVHVGADACYETQEIAGRHPVVEMVTFFSRADRSMTGDVSLMTMGSVAIRNDMAPRAEDGLFWASDDIEFYPDTLERARDTFNSTFPDEDGVVGIFQETPTFHPTGTCLMGQKFLQRYPGKRPFFPGYWLFAAQEVYWLATKYQKYYLCGQARIRHHHPAFDKSQHDKTHDEGRVKKKQDKALARRRMHLGLIWGDEI